MFIKADPRTYACTTGQRMRVHCLMVLPILSLWVIPKGQKSLINIVCRHFFVSLPLRKMSACSQIPAATLSCAATSSPIATRADANPSMSPRLSHNRSLQGRRGVPAGRCSRRRAFRCPRGWTAPVSGRPWRPLLCPLARPSLRLRSSRIYVLLTCHIIVCCGTVQ